MSDVPDKQPAPSSDASVLGSGADIDAISGAPGRPFDRRAPYLFGLLLGLGLLTAYGTGQALLTLKGVIVEIVVAFFIAAGLNPAVRRLERGKLSRPWAVTAVILVVLLVLSLFVVAIVPVITDQVSAIGQNAPGWLDRLQHAAWIQDLDQRYHVVEKIRAFVTDGDFVSSVFGGVLGFGLAVLSALMNVFVVTVLTLYFLGSFATIKATIYRLAPASRRDRVEHLGDRVIDGIGGYVSGAFIVALCAGLTSLIFLCCVGMAHYAVALAFVVMLTDVIPMIGATIGAAVVCAVAFATDVQTGVIAVIFYLVYQQVENYLIYPKVMARSVDVPGVVTVVAALVGASLLGVVGALIAIPVAAAVLMVIREVWVRAQDER